MINNIFPVNLTNLLQVINIERNSYSSVAPFPTSHEGSMKGDRLNRNPFHMTFPKTFLGDAICVT